MLQQSTYLQIDLGVNEAVSLLRAQGSELRCLSGQVWITEENGGGDIVLRAGQSHRLTRSGRTVVQSIGLCEGAQCRVVLPCSPRRLLALLRRWLPEAATGKANLGLVLGTAR